MLLDLGGTGFCERFGFGAGNTFPGGLGGIW
jgi:hypothetical protein